MARFGVVFLALAAVFVSAQCAEVVSRPLVNTKVEGPQGVKGIPKVIESNLPAALNNIALTYSQSALDNSGNLVAASKQLQTKLTQYAPREKWSVAIQPAAYYITSDYFAHYLVNNYHVFLYTVHC